jgi:ribonuclease Z
MQMRRCRIRLGKINHIFISHLHGDHIFGLYGLLSTFNLMGRQNPIHLYAPEGYREMLISHLNDFDINLNFEIDFTPLSGKDPVSILEDKHITVTSFPLRHRVKAYGFLFREKQADRKIIKESISNYEIPVASIRAIKKGEDFVTKEGKVIRNEEITIPPLKPLSYAYCSDTMFFPALAGYVKDVSLLYHEATFDAGLVELARLTGHSTTLDAANTARMANAGTLLIGHFSSRYKDINPLVEEARTIFPNTIPAIDGATYDIGNPENPLNTELNASGIT